jgi:hypothetical protein
VMFRLSGLPVSTPVSITVRGVTETTVMGDPGPLPDFQLIPGSYGYHVGYVAGYHLEVAEQTFAVHGAPLTIDLPFVPTVYSVTWQAQGTRSGVNWSVVVNGQSIAAPSAWLSAALTNGSYGYTVELPPNFTATPRTGVLEVNGSSRTVTLWFTPVTFPMQFVGSGLSASTAWSVRFGNLTQGAASGGSSFMAANGTYTFDVHPPPGYYAVPSHGTVAVTGPMPPIEIQFLPVSNQPSAALVAALTSGALSTAMWIGVSMYGGFLLLRRLRRRRR